MPAVRKQALHLSIVCIDYSVIGTSVLFIYPSPLALISRLLDDSTGTAGMCLSGRFMPISTVYT